MIDWLTLRTPISYFLEDAILAKFHVYVGELKVFDADGECIRSRAMIDVDKIRSDSKGLYWSITSDGKQHFLQIGASPAAIEFNNNVFGSLDIKYCAEVLIKKAEQALAFILPPPSAWECRRLDVTQNYLLTSNTEVKQALRELRKGDGIRQKATVPNGDSVYWGQGSDLISGKAYDKGTQAEYLNKKSKTSVFDAYTLSLLKRILRLELKLGRRWFDRFESSQIVKTGLKQPLHWLELTGEYLLKVHNDYFKKFIGDVKVTEMENNLLVLFEGAAKTKGQALAAYRTWSLIKAVGYENTRESMPKATFCRHTAIMREAGLSQADLLSSNIIPFRQKIIELTSAINSWDELLAA